MGSFTAVLDARKALAEVSPLQTAAGSCYDERMKTIAEIEDAVEKLSSPQVEELAVRIDASRARRGITVVETGTGENVSIHSAEDPRVRLAIERTLLAWIRTGLALMGFGFVVARFGLFLREMEAAHEIPTTSTAHRGASLWLGTALVLLGVVVNLLVSAENVRLLRHVRGESIYGVRSWLMGVVMGVVLAILGIATAVYLVFVAS
jgi:putative membrane protein